MERFHFRGVMPALGAGTHAFTFMRHADVGVDARAKPAHDGGRRAFLRLRLIAKEHAIH
ncbi:MAG: hypothetical protein JOZ88_01130 [Hyphomicrobiales bacterium]|nr:hypothetical protein [Hyphomicrobiales bacterium]